MKQIILLGVLCMLMVLSSAMAQESWLPDEFKRLNVAPEFVCEPHVLKSPIQVAPFVEHIRSTVSDMGSWENATTLIVENGRVELGKMPDEKVEGHLVTASAKQGEVLWQGTVKGLYKTTNGILTRHASYGVDGPLSTKITGLAVDSKGTLWVGTPLGLNALTQDGQWSSLQGRQGLPFETVTSLAISERDELWIGTTQGLILYKPYENGRQWFYREGKRYLPGNHVKSIAILPGGDAVYCLTDGGVGRLDLKKTTLLEKAQIIEKRLNQRHRRLGLVAECELDNAENPTSFTISDNDNDGLWTAYHVAAMALCYGATKDSAAKESAKESMHALYMLQNASGKPGLVARSVVSAEEGRKKDPQWQPTPDGKMYWKSDTSSDEIDGHYLAFYAYYEHVARKDPAEKALIDKQVRALTDYLISNNYQLIDWTGKRTRWGFWNPEALNGNPDDYVESGLNALQILSFLKVAHFITGDEKYQDHYRKLAVDHHYLNNILLSKKSFPDENNHSDDQLGFVAWYPILQLEKDPKIRALLGAGVRRHYEVVKPEKPSFYTFVYATLDPANADLNGAVENLCAIPTDRRVWGMKNSHRADVRIASSRNRFREEVLTHVLPADERVFIKWNGDPYVADEKGDGRREDDGAAYLLPYWMGRYHGFITEVP